MFIKLKTTFLPVTQVTPENPGSHSQLKALLSSTLHSPSFRQGLLAHAPHAAQVPPQSVVVSPPLSTPSEQKFAKI